MMNPGGGAGTPGKGEQAARQYRIGLIESPDEKDSKEWESNPSRQMAQGGQRVRSTEFLGRPQQCGNETGMAIAVCMQGVNAQG